ncbi:MAG: hypothetical protein KDC44_16675 [Phaeodactylibacter sp.]|nr:hypothetical protein [Phaeodactylibacter sp.]
MPKLAHVYSSNHVKRALEHIDAPANLVGILFLRRDPDTGTGSKELLLDPYWVSYDYTSGSGVPAVDPTVTFQKHPLFPPSAAVTLQPTRMIDLETGLPPAPNTFFEFYGNLSLYVEEFGFAFFSKEMLQSLANNASELYLSGALIKSGVVLGIDPHNPGNLEDPLNWSYFTLKMQSAPPETAADDDDSEVPPEEELGVPRVTLGEPCPPYWEIYSAAEREAVFALLASRTAELESDAKCCELNGFTRFLCQVLPPFLHFMVRFFCGLFSPTYKKAVNLNIAAVLEDFELELRQLAAQGWAEFCEETIAELNASSSAPSKGVLEDLKKK